MCVIVSLIDKIQCLFTFAVDFYDNAYANESIEIWICMRFAYVSTISI